MKTRDAPAEVRTALDVAICELQLRVDRAYLGWMKLL